VSDTYRLLSPDSVTIQEVGLAPAAGASAAWSCPMCGQRRPVEQAREAVVQNRIGTPMTRRVWLCVSCLGHAGFIG
jgi:hypothetical protein